MTESITKVKSEELKACPFCGNVPVSRGKSYIVSHEETCFFRRHGRHTKFTDFDVVIWNRMHNKDENNPTRISGTNFTPKQFERKDNESDFEWACRVIYSNTSDLRVVD